MHAQQVLGKTLAPIWVGVILQLEGHGEFAGYLSELIRRPVTVGPT